MQKLDKNIHIYKLEILKKYSASKQTDKKKFNIFKIKFFFISNFKI